MTASRSSRQAFEDIFNAHAQFVYRTAYGVTGTHEDAEDIVYALEQQLGLKVEPIRVPRDFIVIDRVERPAPN